MMTVILNVAATVGLSIAALFGTNVRAIGPNSYFAAKNSTLHARTVQEIRADKSKTALQSFTVDAAAVASTSKMIDQILRDARGVQITDTTALAVQR